MAQATPLQFLPPKHHQGHGFSTVEKQTLEILDAPRSASSLPTYLSWPRPLLRPATMCHAAPPTKAPAASHHAAAPVRKLKAQLKASGIFCQGKHLWSAWCSQDTGTLGLGQRPCPPAKAEVASESKWKFYQHSCEAGAQAPSAHSTKEAVPFLWRPCCWHLELASAN